MGSQCDAVRGTSYSTVRQPNYCLRDHGFSPRFFLSWDLSFKLPFSEVVSNTTVCQILSSQCVFRNFLQLRAGAS